MKLGDRLIAGLQYAIATIVLFLLSAMAVLILWGEAHAEYALLDSPKATLERCYRRCEKNNPPLPSPEPTQSPKPLPCESIGSGSIKTFSAGEMRTLCFTAGTGGPFVEVGTQNHGNASCADYWMQMYSPSGASSEPSRGSQPGAIMARTPGRYVLLVKMAQANNVACSTLTFTVR